MNYGKFFRFNYEKSDLNLGVACYDYIWLRDNENNNELSNFPIYVTISKDSIDFHAHYYDDYLQNGKHIYKHSHNTILSLPLSANVEIKDGLTEALVEGHRTNYPRYEDGEHKTNCSGCEDEESSYLWKLHWKTFWKNRNWEKTDMSYFELDAFVVLPREKKWEELIEEIKESKNEDYYIVERKAKNKSEKINRFIRKLILDFMFDLEHTKVFQTSPHYEHISVKLRENFFFSALAAKANFYYQQELMKYNHGDIYIEDYLKAEKEWTKCIRNHKAQTNFNSFKDKWFDDPEEEMDKVYGEDFKYVNNIVYKYINEEIERKMQKKETEISRNKSSKWLIWHYKLGLGPSKCGNLAFWSRLLFPRLMASILTAWVTVIIGSNLLPTTLPEEWPGESVNVAYFQTAKIFAWDWWWLFILLIALIIYVVIFYSIRQRSLYINRCKILARPVIILLLSLCYSIIFGLILMKMFSGVPLAFPGNYSPNPFFWSCVFLAMFIGVVLQQVTDEKYTEE